jgi:hypothetical protein
MAAPQTNWLPGILVLSAGFVGSVLYLLLSKRAGAAPTEGAKDDVDAKYQSVIGELKEHTANKHLLPAESWEAEKKRLEALAVTLLKQRDGLKHAQLKAEARAEAKAKAQATSTGFFAQNPAMKGAFVGGAVVLFFAVLWITVNEAAKPRTDGMQVTGMDPGAAGPAGPQEPPVDTKMEQLLQAVQRSPDDIDALSEAALYLISKQGFAESRPFIQRATLIDPFHVKTRVGRAILLAVDGDVPGGTNELERLATLYPDGYPGALYAGMLSMEDNNPARAVQNFERYLATAPISEQPPMLRMAVRQLKAQLAGSAPAQP